MAWKVGDRIYETSTTTGTGTYTLDGAVTGFQAFSTLVAANICPYFATDDTNWEVGIGTIATGPNTLARSVILASSNAGSAVNWAAGTRKIRCGQPAEFAAGRAATAARSSNTILGHTDHGTTILATTSFTQTLTAAATLGDGWWLRYRNNGTGTIVLDPNGTETIDGATTLTLGPGESLTLACDGANFYTIGRTPAAYIYIRDEKTTGTNGGTFTLGAWRTRTLNTIVNDTGSNAALGSNQVTLQPGTYRFKARAPAFSVVRHKARLANITDTTFIYGSAQYTPATQTDAWVTGRFTITAAKVFELQHYCETTEVTDGFGVQHGASTGSVIEVYAEIEFWKEDS